MVLKVNIIQKNMRLECGVEQLNFIDIEQSDWREHEFSKPDATINIATLFSGIGAIEHAFERLKLNHKIIFAGDIDKNCKTSYFANYDISDDNWHDDVTKFCAKKYINTVDLLVGGSPCQTFSMVGKRLGLNDTRGTLFYEFARVVNECQPKVFIYENVKGLVNHDQGRTWMVVKDIFNELGYKIFYQTLNSKDYGIPQHRERIFVVGFKDNEERFEFPKKIDLHHKMQDFLEDFTDSKYYLKDKGVKFVTSTWNRKKNIPK